jgi:hypothetical protein
MPLIAKSSAPVCRNCGTALVGGVFCGPWCRQEWDDCQPVPPVARTANAEGCTCVPGTGRWMFVGASLQKCRRCGAVRRKVQ